jgi:hypothetical protein
MARYKIQFGDTSMALVGKVLLARAFVVERVTGIEPALSAWEMSIRSRSRT